MPNIAFLYRCGGATPMVLREDHRAALRAHNPDGEVRFYETEEEMLRDGFDAEVLISWGRFTPNEFCNRCTDLRWIQSISAGTEGLDRLDAVRRGVPVTKMSGVHGVPMSETTLGYILYFLRGFDQIAADRRARRWHKPDAPAPRECRDQTVGILGLGEIGGEVARRCSGLGMRVIGCRRSPHETPFVDEVYPADEIDRVLAASDFVVCLLPHTPETERSIGAARFAAMKPTAVFINIGRGAVVDHAALADALDRGTIAGAALDALDPEPLPPESPLWDMPNVLITPHCAADSPFYFYRAIPVICRNLDAYLQTRK